MSQTWITDENGNRCSVEYFGSEETARTALESLRDCRGCTNCTRCYDCSYCTHCSDCSYCTYCSDCTRCYDCSHCAHYYDRTAPQIPVIPDIHKRIYERVSQPNALDMSDWHSCETTHCRAGWVVHLAGDAGYALEKFHNTELAAVLIYRASGYEISPERFFDDADDAMADMKRLAEGA